MQSSHEDLFYEETCPFRIEDITVVASNLSEKFWDALREIGEEILFSNTEFINLANRIDEFKEIAVRAALHLTNDELEEWVSEYYGELDEFIQAAAKLLSSHGKRPFASNLHEWNARLTKEEEQEAAAAEHLDILTVETLASVASVRGLLPDGLREEAAILVEEARRFAEWEDFLDPFVDSLRHGMCKVQDVSDLLGYVAQCAQDYCHGNLKAFLRMIDFDLGIFLQICEARDNGEFSEDLHDLVEELLTDFGYFVDQLRVRILHRLREMWKVEAPQPGAYLAS